MTPVVEAGVQSRHRTCPSIGTSVASSSMAVMPSRVNSVMLGVADHPEQRVEPDPGPHRAGLRGSRAGARPRRMPPRSARSASYTGRSKVAGGNAPANTICSAKSPSSATASWENVPRPAPISRSVPSCWPARTTCTASCSPRARTTPLDPGLLCAEDELGVVGRAGRHRRRRTRNVALVLVDVVEEPVRARRPERSRPG